MLNFGPPPPASPTLEQLFAQAMAHHQAGRLAQAEPVYRQLLALQPNHFNALHMLGVLASQAGNSAAAIELIKRAVALNPNEATSHGNLGEILRKAGQLSRAEAELRRAIALQPQFADAYCNLALLLLAQNRDQEAEELLQAGIRHVPGHATLFQYLGDAFSKEKRFPEALQAYEEALRLRPQLVDARYNMGVILAELGRIPEAEAAFRAVLAVTPQDWDAHEHLADMLARRDRTGEAVLMLREVCRQQPQRAKTFYLLGNMLRNINFVDDAIAAYQRCLELTPDDRLALANLALAYRDQARLDESVALHRKALDSMPTAAAVHSSLIFTLHLVPHVSRAVIEEEQRRWNERHANPLANKRLPHGNDRSPDRRLLIGYVSADLRAHPVGRFMLPLLRNLDRSQVEVFCYSVARGPDGQTEKLRAATDQWRHAAPLNDDELAAQVRADGIDVLIDLSNHTIDNRMLMFARKPAPVQITYLAYCAGTGLSTMDWRLTDPHMDPPGGPADSVAYERPLRLAETYWCYEANSAACEVTPPPALQNGYVTFGSLNYFSKCNDQVLQLWARLLSEMPGTRLALHVPAGSREAYVRRIFEKRGVSPERLTLLPRCRQDVYFQHYQKVDIALDPFPWAGGTTTCDALWMGVPVVTLAEEGPGADTVSRGGLSLLSNLGYREWVARSEEEYLAKAKELAGDLGRLAAVRQGLRGRMAGSVLMDAPRFAKNMVAAYRQAWKTWCEGG